MTLENELGKVVDDQDLLQGYGAALRGLIFCRKPRNLNRDVMRLLAACRRLAQRRDGKLRDALEEVHHRTTARVIRRLRSAYVASRSESPQQVRSAAFDRLAKLLLDKPGPVGAAADFWCDAALGGLARWLRAAGYDARWEEGIDDDVLLRRVTNGWAILLTTDRPLFERGVIRWGLVPALWVSPALDRHEQLTFCVEKLQLVRRAGRCMRCGGRLAAASKSNVAGEVPPRTLTWQQQFYRCRRCRKVLWKGTHWQRIERRLAEALPPNHHSDASADDA